MSSLWDGSVYFTQKTHETLPNLMPEEIFRLASDPTTPALWVVTLGGLASKRFPFGTVARLL